MPVRINTQHPNITENPQTFLAESYVSGTVITVDNGTLWAQGDYIVIEKYGSSQCEIGQVLSSGADYINLVGDLVFPHSVDVPITRIDYNQYQVYYSTTGIGGSYVALGTPQSFMVSQPTSSQVLDLNGTTAYSYKTKYLNTTNATVSQFSDESPAGGYPFYALGSIQPRVLTIFVDSDAEFISNQSIADWTNELLGRANRDVTDSESGLFMDFLTFTPGTSEYTDLSQYNIENISLVQYSTDGGQTFPNTISFTDSRIPAPSQVTQYSYRLEGDKMFIFSGNFSSNSNTFGLPNNDMVRVWYFTQQPQLSLQSDNLPAVYRSFSPVFVDYCLMRAAEQSRRMTESASWYYKKLFIGANRNEIGNYTEMINSIKLRISQGNKSMASTWINSINNY